MALTETTDSEELAAEGAVERRKSGRIRHGAARPEVMKSSSIRSIGNKRRPSSNGICEQIGMLQQ